MWSGPETGVQGVSELSVCERTDDKWLQSVQEEFRYGKLNADTHAFLHGEKTLRPGSALKSGTECKSDWCKQRVLDVLALEKDSALSKDDRGEHVDITYKGECKACKIERKKGSSWRQGHRINGSWNVDS